MKKILLTVTFIASISAYGLPTYEPFTEYSSAVAGAGTNSIDLAAGGYSVTTGSVVERWTSLNFSATGASPMGSHPPSAAGWDIQVTNMSASVFTSTALASILPSTFPGYPSAGNAINLVAYIPSNNINTNNSVGNSAVLNLSQDIVRPASGTKTIFVSYLLDIVQQGTTGAGNNGRYCYFTSLTNLVEGAGTSGFYQNPEALLNTYSTAGAGPSYVSYGVKSGYTGGGDWILASDSAGGNTPATELAGVGTAYNTPAFVVGAFVFTTGAPTKDTNILWVNPSTSSFGGVNSTAISAAPYKYTMTNIQMSDVAGFVLEDRLGGGWAGGIGNMYMANLIVGTTWSYVTGGPEFTNQPVAGIDTNYGSTVSINAAAVAAGQTVSYQWKKNGVVVNPGAGGAGGGATVTITVNNNVSTLTLAGLTAADYGTYTAVATASSTGYTLTTSNCVVTADPNITVEPQNATAARLGSATFNVAATTQYPSLTYQWQLNGGALSDGTLGDGTVVAGSSTTSLTLTDLHAGEFGTYDCAVTNGIGEGELSSNAVLSLVDPAITANPVNVTVDAGGTATFSASFQTAHGPVSYAWYDGLTVLNNGPQPDGSTATDAQGSVAGSGTITLTLSGVTELDNGSYSLIVTNSVNAAADSSAATLFVIDPYIGTQPPAIVEVAQGGGASIPVTAYGANLTYVWNGAVLPGDYSGTTTSTLTLANAQAGDQGTFNVTITGASNTVTSTTVDVYVDTAAPAAAAVTPPKLTQQAGTHLAVVGTVTGGTGLINFVWQFNGVTLTNGLQADGSFVSGAGTQIPAGAAPVSAALVLSNLQTLDSGTYTLIASNLIGTASSAASIITVSNGYLPLAISNLVVARVGDGSQTLSGATGNTLYLDQFATNGAYVSTIMVPDSGTGALIVPGGGNDGQNEAYLTMSSNGGYLTFGGYFQIYPFAGSDVTVGGAADIRSIGEVTAQGYYYLAYTNFGLYSGGDHFIRSAFSTDGLLNFWTTGAAGSGAVKYVNAGPAGAAYSTGNSIPALGPNETNGPRVVGIYGTNIVFSESATNNGLGGASDGPTNLGIVSFFGQPETTPDPTVNILSTAGGMSHPADFAFSPDTNTLYVADDDITSGSSGNGGVQRYDWNGTYYNYSYNLYDSTSVGTNGLRGLAVYFPPNHYGPGVTGAVLYATTSETVSNRLVQIIDNGAGSPSTLLGTAGPNQFYRGVRFGPAPLPITFVTPPASFGTFVGQSNILTAVVNGDAPLSYQWQFDGTNIAGATTSSLVLTNLQITNSGTYTLVVSDLILTNSSSAVVTISSGPPIVLVPPQSRVETVGDHLAFSLGLSGTLPLYYQWSSNGAPVAGATNSYFGLSNIVLANSGTYSVTYSNQFGTNTASATLLVTTNLQALASTNLVVARVGDGAETLSISTGNTVYLDQFTTGGAYSNTIMIPDNMPANGGNLIVPGGTPEALENTILTRSVNSNFLNFAGFDTPYPAANFNVPVTYRSIFGVDAYGYYAQMERNQTIYDGANDETFNCAASVDGFAEFWTTGSAGSGASLKYATTATAGSGGGIPSIGGSLTGTRAVNIVSGNVAYTDSGVSPAGIYGFLGEPVASATSALIISDAGGSPQDFSASPDISSFPPASGTVYLCDASSGANGGVQRWDWNGAGFTLSYTLGTGATNGGSCLVVDYSANSTWGPGVLGAKIYATTAGPSSNALIKIIDNGAGSIATVLEQAPSSQVLRGVRFGPVAGPAVVTAPPSQSVFVGGTATFSVTAQNGPIYGYQWELNGQPLANGASISGSGAIISGANTSSLTVSNAGAADNSGSYTVIVTNYYSTAATSVSAVLSVPVNLTSFPPAEEFVIIGSAIHLTVGATGGLPLTYQWAFTGPLCNGTLSDGLGGDPCDPSAVVAGSSTSALTISGVSTNDDGSYTVTVSNPNPSSTNTTAHPSVVTVVSQPQFLSSGAVTGLGSAPQLNFTGTANTPYSIWATTNLALKPVESTWTLLGSGTFIPGTNVFSLTTNTAEEFYLITQP